MDNINNLLNQVGIIVKKNEEILNATGGLFNVFKICRMNHYENAHSNIIAELLNPNGTHGLQSKMLECFVQLLEKKALEEKALKEKALKEKALKEKEISRNEFSFKDFNCRNAEVFREHSNEEGRIDIIVRDDKKMIIIENKIYAKDQDSQLKRYEKFAKKKASDYQIIYLTLFGNEASAQSGEGVLYHSISYKENIINWLEKCLELAVRHPTVRETIIQYINHLKTLTNQNMNNEKEEILEILGQNLKAARSIYQNYEDLPSVFHNIAERYFNPKMREFARNKVLEYNYSESNERYIFFSLRKSEWPETLNLEFHEDGDGYFYGLASDPGVYRLSQENQTILDENLKELGIEPRSSEWWAFYSHDIPSLTIENWEDKIIKSSNFFDDCVKRIDKLLEAMKGMKF